VVKYKDYYQSLGVDRSAAEKDIKAAYRKLARQYHPDANPGDKSAEERFKEISEAYEVLKDPDKRRKYDLLGANWKNGSDFTPPPGFGGFAFDFGNFQDMKGSPFSDFFESLFGQHFGPPSDTQGARGFGTRTLKGQDTEAEIELTIDEIALGTTRNIHVSGPTSTKPKTLQVKIPAGVRAGSKVRVPGEGGMSAGGGTSGDLYLIVKVKPHPHFTIEGENLVSELQISPALAVLGGEATVTTLDGSVRINIPPLSQSGRLLRLRERGLPRLKQTTRGDQLVRLKITIPTSPDPEETALYERLLEVEQNKKQAAAG